MIRLTERMKKQLKLHHYVDTRNYEYKLNRYYDGSCVLLRIPMDDVKRQTTNLIDGWEILGDVKPEEW